MSSPSAQISTSSVEKTLLGMGEISYLIIDDGRPVAAFSVYLDAYKYMIRVTVNSCLGPYTETVDDQPDYKSTEQTYTNFLKDYIKDYMKIVPVHHLDLSKPVYICMSSNYCVRGQPTDYVTNSEKDWILRMNQLHSRVKCNINDFILEVNPSIPELDSFPTEDE
ncbi:MAG: hypothetical protein PHG66_06100 [Candidatus Colwellbacteria bacterium]|nr:hypothetical protein [Candidatus Colwellbacteria bacterium]